MVGKDKVTAYCRAWWITVPGALRAVWVRMWAETGALEEELFVKSVFEERGRYADSTWNGRTVGTDIRHVISLFDDYMDETKEALGVGLVCGGRFLYRFEAFDQR
jgi:hypothetical protein